MYLIFRPMLRSSKVHLFLAIAGIVFIALNFL